MNIRGLWCREVAAETTLVTLPVPRAAVRAPHWRSAVDEWTKSGGGSQLKLSRKRMPCTWNMILVEEDSDLILQQCVTALWTLWGALVHQLEIKFLSRRGVKEENNVFFLKQRENIQDIKPHKKIVKYVKNHSLIILLAVINHWVIYYNCNLKGENYYFALPALSATVWRVITKFCFSPAYIVIVLCFSYLVGFSCVFHDNCLETKSTVSMNVWRRMLFFKNTPLQSTPTACSLTDLFIGLLKLKIIQFALQMMLLQI